MDAAKRTIAHNLAASLLATAWTARALQTRAERYLGRATRKSQRKLIREPLLGSVPNAYPPSPDWLVAFPLSSARFVRASAPLRRKAARPPVVLSPAIFAPSPAFAGLDVPKLATPGDLAKWLDVSVEQLDWLADSRHQHVNTAIPVLQHYFYTGSSWKKVGNTGIARG